MKSLWVWSEKARGSFCLWMVRVEVEIESESACRYSPGTVGLHVVETLEHAELKQDHVY